MLFSTTDLFSLHLSSLKEELEGNYHVLLPNAEVVQKLVNKKKFYQSLSSYRIPYPVTYFPNSIDDVKEISKKIKFPIFIRPAISQIFVKAFHKKGFLANSAKELINYYRLSSKFEIDTIFQEVVSGPAKNLYGIAGYFDRKSLPKVFFVYQRLRGWPLMFGTNSLIVSIPTSDVQPIKETAKNYLHQLRYHGLMEAEFKRDPQDGIFKLLEINARSWWQNSFPTKCGINIVFISYLDAIGKEIEYTEDYEAGIKWMHFLNDLRSSIKTKNITMKDWISSLRNIKDWAYFSADDPIPWMINPLFEFYSLLRKYRRIENLDAS